MDNINFKKVLCDEELFDQQANYEDNFEKINQLVVPKITDLETNKVDKVAGKGLSTNDFDNTYKQKIDTDIPAQLADIENVQLPLKTPKTDIGLLTGLLTTAKTSIVNAINELFNSKANKAQEEWITPTLMSAWIPFDNNFSQPAYFKDEFGFVHLKGMVKRTTGTATDLMVLPIGYRPLKSMYFSGARSGSDASRIAVLRNGYVYLESYSNTWTSIDGISFKAD